MPRAWHNPRRLGVPARVSSDEGERTPQQREDVVTQKNQLEKEPVMDQLNKVLYTAKTHTTGGRDGASRSSDGRLDITLSSPGAPGNGTNPEQLFAAGWSACFIGAMGVVASKMKVQLPADRALDAEVDLGTNQGGFVLRARLNISLPGLDRETALALVKGAHETCPYSKATRGNIEVELNLL
jgi:lipoyl-dependent peroxiredoxin